MRRVAFVALLAWMLVLPSAAGAGEKDPKKVPDAPPAREVIATGLDNPRGLEFGRHGVLYVAEAGRGGDGPCFAGPEGDACYGDSGAITAIDDGEQYRILEGLPSTAAPDGRSATGPHDVGLAGRHLYATIGLGNDPAILEEDGVLAGSDLGRVIRVNLRKGSTRTVADIAEFEAEENPDGGLPDTNPYGLLVSGRRIYVADAGGNSVLRVGRHGISTVAVLPDRLVDAPAFLELPEGEQIPMQAVPTEVVRGRHGALYVSQLTGFPYPVGEATVWRIGKKGQLEPYAEGFTNVVDIAFDRRGNLYVLELASNGLLSEDLTGALIRVARDGTRTTVGDLFAPGGVTLGRDGAAYVTTCSVCAGGGEVVRLDFPG